jgi:hypothetical protein
MIWKNINGVGARLMAIAQGSIGFDVQSVVDESFLPTFDESFIDGIIDYSNSSKTLVHNNESIFNEFASDKKFDKRDKMERSLFDGTLAVEGGLGMGFQAYDGKRDVYNPYNKLETKFEDFLLKYDLSE